MNAQECLKRTAECTRLAEATNDPGLREYLTKLASSWMQATTTAERNERLPAEVSQRRLSFGVQKLDADRGSNLEAD